MLATTSPASAEAPAEAPQKPLLRGVFHQWAAGVALGAGAVLVGMAPGARSALAAGVFAASLVALFAVSATYHRVDWQPVARQRMRRLDHAAIFVLIAGSYTPIGLVALGPGAGTKLCLLAWAGAAIGVLKSLVWVQAPKAVTAAVAVAVGWCIVPFLSEARAALDSAQLGLILGGGVFYTAGAVSYALKRPNVVRGLFGYHEVFHACTVVAAALHFAGVVLIVRGARG